MPNQVQTIIRKATRQPDEPLNIITFPSDDHYDISLAETQHNFWALTIPGSKPWSKHYPLPRNYQLVPTVNGKAVLPNYVDFDLCIAHDRGPQYDIAQHFRDEYDFPVVLVEHALPPPEWNDHRMVPLRAREGTVNVFVAECQKAAWGFHKDYECIVNLPGVNTKLFTPAELQRDTGVMWFGNNIMHKDEIYGFDIMRYVTGFPMPMMQLRIVGDNQGISRLPNSLDEYVAMYSRSAVFLNTCKNNPLPITILEAMACGCPVVSLAVGEIPSLIKNGETGFISKNPEDLRGYCVQLLTDKELAARISANARELIRRKFGISRFTKTWQTILKQAIKE